MFQTAENAADIFAPQTHIDCGYHAISRRIASELCGQSGGQLPQPGFEFVGRFRTLPIIIGRTYHGGRVHWFIRHTIAARECGPTPEL